MEKTIVKASDSKKINVDLLLLVLRTVLGLIGLMYVASTLHKGITAGALSMTSAILGLAIYLILLAMNLMSGSEFWRKRSIREVRR